MKHFLLLGQYGPLSVYFVTQLIQAKPQSKPTRAGGSIEKYGCSNRQADGGVMETGVSNETVSGS